MQLIFPSFLSFARHDFHPSDRFRRDFDETEDEDLELIQVEDILIDMGDIEEWVDDAGNTGAEDDTDIEFSNDDVMSTDDDDSPDISDESDSETTAEESTNKVIPSTSADQNGTNDNNKGSNSVDKRIIDDYDEESEEDEVLRAIIKEIKKPRSKPPDIKTEDFVVDLSFHPTGNLLSVATVTGDILIYKYANDENTLVKSLEVHTKACRNVEFTSDGLSFISTSRDKTIMITDTETGKLKRFWDDAHQVPVYSMAVLDENLFATGDDEGMIKLWDVRQRDATPIFALKEVDDYISCIISNDAKKYLLATSGDGYLTTLSIPGKRLYVQSEPYEEELTTMGIFRNDSKVIVGTSKGNFYAFNWGQFGYHCDAFCGPSTPLTKMVPITERIAVTGGEEGILRAMHMVPGRILGIVGQHNLAVETMDINATGEIIASSSHDNDIRFWNVKYFEDFDDIKYNEKPNTKRALKHNLPSSNFSNRADFFADLA